MNTLALVTTSSPLQAADPEMNGGFEALTRRFLTEERAPVSPILGESGPIKALVQTVGFRLACDRVVRWYHGGINE